MLHSLELGFPGADSAGPSGLSQISKPAGLAPGQHRWVHASLPEGPSLHRGQCLTRMSPLDSCKQCRASSWLVPAPGKMLEQAAVSRSSTGLWEQGREHREGEEEITVRAGRAGGWLGPAHPPTQPRSHRVCLLVLTLPLLFMAAL